MPTRNTFIAAALLTVVVVDAARFQIPDAKVLYYLRDGKLYRMKPPFLEEELLENDVSDFELDGNAQPLWMDDDARIYRSGGELVLHYKPSVSSARFALDHSTDKFYVVDGDSQKVDVLQPGGKRAVIFDDPFVVPEKSKMIAVDPSTGLMFVLTDLDGVKNIYRADMDGTGRRELVADVSCDELSVDARRRKIYWLNGKKRIVESVDFDGIKRKPVGGLVGVTNNTAIAVLDGDIYWSVYRGLISICKLREDSCDKSTLHRLRLSSSNHPVKSLKLSYSNTAANSRNACHWNNGGCKHMCLLNSRIGNSCVCHVGWETDGGNGCRLKNTRRHTKTPWYSYMTPHPTWKPQRYTRPSNGMADLAGHIAAIGK